MAHPDGCKQSPQPLCTKRYLEEVLNMHIKVHSLYVVPKKWYNQKPEQLINEPMINKPQTFFYNKQYTTNIHSLSWIHVLEINLAFFLLENLVSLLSMWIILKDYNVWIKECILKSMKKMNNKAVFHFFVVFFFFLLNKLWISYACHFL